MALYIVPSVVQSAYEYELFTSVHTIYQDNFFLTSVACVLSSYTISCRGSTNVTVKISGNTLLVTGWYGEVFDDDILEYRKSGELADVLRVYNYDSLPDVYYKATKYLPDRRPTTSISITVVTDKGVINTTQSVKNNWDYKRSRLHTFIKRGTLDTENVFLDGTLMSLPDAVGPFMYNVTKDNTVIPVPVPPPSVSYLIVAGGGSGGPSQYGLGGGGGGGAGGVLSGTTSVSIGALYTFTVGAGGAAAPANNIYPGNDGGNSTAFGLTAIGGGGGGNGSNGTYQAGRAGGSGGGGGYRGYTTQANGGSGTVGQGNNGSGVISGSASGGGGGGATGAGQPNSNSGGVGFGGSGGLGGTGYTWIDGNTYAVGGQGGYADVQAQADATPNTGNGGIGSYAIATTYAGASGVIIIRYSSVYKDATIVTGSPIYTNSGGWKTYKFIGGGTIAF